MQSKHPFVPVRCLCALLLITLSSVATANAATNAPAISPSTTNAVPVGGTKFPWDITISAGLTLTRGNSDTILGTAQANAVRKWKKNELDLGGDMTYGENEGIKNNESFHGFLQYNWFFQERFYGSLRSEVWHDDIADIQYRAVVSPSLGYYLVKSDTAFLRAEVGPGFVFQKLGDEAKQYTTLRASERGEWKITKTAKIWEFVEVLPQVDRLQNVIVNGEVGIESAISTHFSLRAFLQNNYNNEPAPGRERNDVKLVTAISYKL